LANFRDQGGVDLVIIDLRTNGGGALTEAIEVSGLFIDQGPVVQVKEQDGEVKPHNDEESGVAYSGPLVVICNRLSASASEIFAGVIQDYHRGIIVGDTTTHGKGTVQNVMPVGRQMFQWLNPQDRGALKLTINQFYRVNGDSTQNRGVRSDVVLPSMFDHMDLGESFLENALAFDRIKPAKYESLNLVDAKILSSLRQLSQKRVAADSGFQKDQRAITKYVARKNRKTVSLNEDTLRKEREKDQADAGDEEQTDLFSADEDGPIFPKGHYNDEVLRIGVDYVQQLKSVQTASN
jgi:carboxyl-terminal processing protease